MDSAAGWGGGTAKVQSGEGRTIEAPGGTEEELAGIERAAIEIAADEVGIVAFHGGGAEKVAPQNALAEAGGKALHLRLNGIRHVRRGRVRQVAVGPGGMLSMGSAGGVEECVLDEENERRAGVAGFPMGDLVEGAAEVHGAGASAGGGAPGDGAVQRPVDLECAGAVARSEERRVGKEC